MLGGMYKITCSYCGCHEVTRLRRSRLERILRRHPKFLCLRCRRKFFRQLPPEQTHRPS